MATQDVVDFGRREEHSRRVLAFRSCARCLPFAFSHLHRKSDRDQAEQLFLVFLRALLTSYVICSDLPPGPDRFPQAEVTSEVLLSLRDALSDYSHYVNQYGNMKVGMLEVAPWETLKAAERLLDDPVGGSYGAAKTVFESVARRSNADDPYWESGNEEGVPMLRDLEALSSGQTSAELLAAPLWPFIDHAEDGPWRLLSFPLAGRDRPAFDFWNSWFDGLLEGRRPEVELQRRVVLIPDADWERGPEHIAGLIEEIEARHEVGRRVAELEASIGEFSRYGIGHNQPPEPLSEELPTKGELLVIWEPLNVLKEELSSDAPLKGRLDDAKEWLIAMLVACGKWTWGHIDAGIKACSQEIGKRAGQAVLLYLASQSGPIKALIDALSRWIGAL